jgi:ribosomal protein L11 methyltransferase
VISTLLENIAPVLKPNGIFICSGIIAAKKDMILDKMAAIGMHVLEVACQDEWVAIAGQR